MFRYSTKIHLHDTDAAGLIFFANQFKILHDAYEELLEDIGCSFQDMILHKDFFLPIVHASCDYKAPLFVGDKVHIAIKTSHIGRTSFTFDYEMTNDDGAIVGKGQTVHCSIDKTKHVKIPLPAELIVHIQKFQV